MKKQTIIEIFAFLIPAVFSYMSYSYGDTAERIGYAIAIGFVFFLPISGIARGADETYRQTASVSDKVSLVLSIIAFPLIYLFISDFYSRTQNSGRCMNAWVSLIVALLLLGALVKISEYIVKLFEK